MSGARGASVVIIGGGVTGLSAGWWLARAGIDVLLIEKGIVGWEASGRNGGGAAHSFSPLFAEEQRLWPQMDELLGYPTEFRPHRVRVALTDTQLAYYAKVAGLATQQGFSWEKLDRQQLQELAPLVNDAAIGGILLNFGGQANPQRTVQAFAWAMQDCGGRILQHTTVTGMTLRTGKVVEVATDRGRFACDMLVIAAGPQTGLLARMAGVDLPLAFGRVEQIVTEPLPLMKLGWVDGNGLYGRQTLRGNLAYGGGPHDWVEVESMRSPANTSTYVSRHLAKRVAELFPRAAHARVIRSWAGIVENTPDGRPVIDRLGDPRNLVIATMSSVGFGLCPASGHAIKQLVVDGACSFADLRGFSFDRLKSVPPDWRERRGWLPSPQAADPVA
ncbi:FAD-binding oxidoreductase [Hypericibacter terrae]|uniref:FAD-binding oxidoreductase n=1 Tax=Hypericibacter terrae TaxID=2602015 RepID=A0A5J6MEX1_9PROT|nr:FAD-binding oxidoreductase [Hypericibacter terrae]QEX15567.1 FAD-binding oxidoreductase [Hypericibacter terrae]